MAITVSEKEGILIFRLRGKIIAPGIKEVSECIEEALEVSSSPPKLMFNFKEVTRIDCAGLGVLMKIYSDIYPRGGKMALINMNKHIRHLIVGTRLITCLEYFKSEDDALNALLRNHCHSK